MQSEWMAPQFLLIIHNPVSSSGCIKTVDINLREENVSSKTQLLAYFILEAFPCEAQCLSIDLLAAYREIATVCEIKLLTVLMTQFGSKFGRLRSFQGSHEEIFRL